MVAEGEKCICKLPAPMSRKTWKGACAPAKASQKHEKARAPLEIVSKSNPQPSNSVQNRLQIQSMKNNSQLNCGNMSQMLAFAVMSLQTKTQLNIITE